MTDISSCNIRGSCIPYVYLLFLLMWVKGQNYTPSLPTSPLVHTMGEIVARRSSRLSGIPNTIGSGTTETWKAERKFECPLIDIRVRLLPSCMHGRFRLAFNELMKRQAELSLRSPPYYVMIVHERAHALFNHPVIFPCGLGAAKWTRRE